MTLPDLLPAGCEAGKAALRPEFGHKKTLPFEGQGWYSVRTRERRQNASLALRITPKPNFGAIRYEFSW